MLKKEDIFNNHEVRQHPISDKVSGPVENFCITALHSYLGMLKALCASTK